MYVVHGCRLVQLSIPRKYILGASLVAERKRLKEVRVYVASQFEVELVMAGGRSSQSHCTHSQERGAMVAGMVSYNFPFVYRCVWRLF